YAPLERERQVGKEARGRLVEGLKQTATENATVDHRTPQREQRGEERVDAPVDPAAPPGVPEGVEPLRVLEVEEAFGLAVASLLADVGLDGVAPEVPHHGRGTEGDAVAALLKAPAHIHVVAGRAVDGIEPADLLEHLAAERHVAARDVLSLLVVQEYVQGPARRGGHATGHHRILGRR